MKPDEYAAQFSPKELLEQMLFDQHELHGEARLDYWGALIVRGLFGVERHLHAICNGLSGKGKKYKPAALPDLTDFFPPEMKPPEAVDMKSPEELRQKMGFVNQSFEGAKRKPG